MFSVYLEKLKSTQRGIMRAIFHSIKKTGNVMYKFSTTKKKNSGIHYASHNQKGLQGTVARELFLN